MFLRAETQWKHSAMGAICGLDYAGLDGLFRILRVKNRREIFEDLQIMERAALSVFIERSKSEKAVK